MVRWARCPHGGRLHSIQSMNLEEALKRYFGFNTFRPGQRQIVERAIQGHDQLVLMPTGGGKSLTYQLPALLLPGLTVVVSPLIALMHDQVDRLRENGIAATYINSSLTSKQRTLRELAVLDGQVKLLYLAPERLLTEECLALLERTNLSLLAIDEAHCVSEWGHDFRPEYRQISKVRERFPALSVLALTATATERVRQDIHNQLQLRDPDIHIASFNRPNLTYEVRPKHKQSYSELLAILRSCAGKSVIIYCQSRKAVESLSAHLEKDGIQSAPYHAGLSAQLRIDTQDRFIRDDIPVLVATVAFGMGIGKPDVRAVIHFDLPRNLEGYYQESGRAGRDGLPASCVLFFSNGDRAKVEYMIAQKPDPQEQRVARAQLSQVVAYAESAVCRRRIQLGYFGEVWEVENCGACDNCLRPVPTEDRSIDAQKFLSCVYRCQERFGMRHTIEVLRGADTEKIRSLGHDKLSTYGIGTDYSQDEWSRLGRTLLHEGLLSQTDDGYPVLKLNPLSWEVLRGQRQVMVAGVPSQPSASQARSDVADSALDADSQGLFDHLRQLRKRLADEQSVPPYVIFPDTSLKAMARHRPLTQPQFLQMPGVGSRKAEAYCQTFTDHIRGYCRSFYLTAPLDIPTSQPAAVQPAGSETSTIPTREQTLALWRQGLSVVEIAQQRSFKASTIEGHLADLIEAGEEIDIDSLVTIDQRRAIEQAIQLHGDQSLKLLKDQLDEGISYGLIRIVQAARIVGQKDVGSNAEPA
ncbi:MAG: DNA helicase RecQ [Anaerolineae bacterium]|nr:DNA helicase RecQ [Gloeobacterales cyanobacterium ES-bin-313]